MKIKKKKKTQPLNTYKMCCYCKQVMKLKVENITRQNESKIMECTYVLIATFTLRPCKHTLLWFIALDYLNNVTPHA